MSFRCLCGSTRFSAHQRICAEVIVDGYGEFVDNLPGGLGANIYDAESPYGPFTCLNCGREYDELGYREGVTIQEATNWIRFDGKTRRYKVGYIDPEGYKDEDEFTAVTRDELEELWGSFCDEYDCAGSKVLYVEPVEKND